MEVDESNQVSNQNLKKVPPRQCRAKQVKSKPEKVTIQKSSKNISKKDKTVLISAPKAAANKIVSVIPEFPS